jgi:hypothetical protein
MSTYRVNVRLLRVSTEAAEYMSCLRWQSDPHLKWFPITISRVKFAVEHVEVQEFEP